MARSEIQNEKKASQIKKHRGDTGGGPEISSDIGLTDVQEKNQ